MTIGFPEAVTPDVESIFLDEQSVFSTIIAFKLESVLILSFGRHI